MLEEDRTKQIFPGMHLISYIHTQELKPSFSYLLKPHDTPWEEGMIAIEAGRFGSGWGPGRLTEEFSPGSGQGALQRILCTNPNLFGSEESKQPRYSAHEIYSFVRYVSLIVAPCYY